ncbi:putative quinol monooxygenase [Kitasatospora sp. NPDC052896]|uniref:putative quinol monooxygenase n=1 Tax=Kitasatospora sp. NPDC052896 TaxID=3364061 RepID=UPI0037C79BCC
MTKIGLRAHLEARPERAEELAQLLTGALELARAERATVTWYAFREGPTTFGIFDTFEGEEGREAHLNGAIAQALMERAPELLAAAPQIIKVDVLAAKAG